MGSNLNLNYQIEEYINSHSIKLHPVQYEIIKYNETHPPTKEEMFDRKIWKKSIGWVNKKTDDPLFWEQAEKRMETRGVPTSLSNANWSYNKEEWIKQKKRQM